MSAGPYLSIVVPLRDEVDALETLHRELTAALSGLTGGAEILFVDDGSTDGSLSRLREIASKDARVRVLALDGPHGQTAALDAGFRAARGEVTATLDADLQNDPADLPRLLARLEGRGPGAGDAVDVVNGVRVGRRDTLSRRLASRIANGFRNAVTGAAVTDVGCSLRVMRTRFVRRVKLRRGLHRFLPTLLELEGARLAEMPVHHRPRRSGRSKYGVADRFFTGLVDTFAVRWMQSRALRYRVDEERKTGS